MESTPSPNDPDHRFVQLEEKILFQQRALEELNEVVLTQQTELDSLRGEVKSLRAMIKQLMEDGTGEDLPHEKPPHY